MTFYQISIAQNINRFFKNRSYSEDEEVSGGVGHRSRRFRSLILRGTLLLRVAPENLQEKL